MQNQIRANNYILYARKSSEGEDRQIASEQDQIAEMKRIALRDNLHVVEIISESQSAKKPGRQGFGKLVRAIESRKIDGVLCWALDRLARNPIDGGHISWLLQTGAIRHIKTNSGEHTPKDNVLTIQMQFGMANQYIKELSDNVKRGLRQKAERGWFPGALPLGYIHHSPRKHGASNREVQPHPDTFPKVKRLWKLLLTGKYSVRDLHLIANKMNTQYFKDRKISLNGLYKTFNNPFYFGLFQWRDDQGTLVEYMGLHKPMITREEFERARKIIKLEVSSDQLARKETKTYQDLMRCGACGRGIVTEVKIRATCENCKRRFSLKKRESCPDCELRLSEMHQPYILEKTYYHCNKRGRGCKEQSIEATELERFFRIGVSKLHLCDHFYDCAKAMLIENTDEEERFQKTMNERLYDQKKILADRLDRLLLLALDNALSKDEYQEARSKIESEIREIDAKIEAGTVPGNSLQFEALRCLDLGKDAAKVFFNGTFEDKRNIIREISSNRYLFQKKLLIPIHLPLQTVIDGNDDLLKDPDMFEPESIFSPQEYFPRRQLSKKGINHVLAVMAKVRTQIEQMHMDEINKKITPKVELRDDDLRAA